MKTKSPYPSLPSFAQEKDLMLDLLGLVIVKQPEHIRKLLSIHGIHTSNQPKAKELVSKIIYAIDNRGVGFHLELAILLSQQLQQISSAQQYDSYQFHQTVNKKRPNQQEDAYVGLIMGAISGVASTVQSISNKKQRRAQASQEMLASIMNAKKYQAQQAQIMARAEAQNVAKKQADEKQLKLIRIIAPVVLIGFTSLVAWMVYQSQESEQVLA